MPEESTTTTQSEAIVVDGYRIDPETGEVLGHVTATDVFHVHDRDTAEWVLQRMQEADAQASAIRLRRAAILELLETQETEYTRRRQWLEVRFGQELADWARGELVGKRTKTLTTDYGQIAFRSVAGRLAVREGVATREVHVYGEVPVEPSPLVGWAARECPQALKLTEEFQISRVPAGMELPEVYFEQTEPRETVKIDTGIK